MKLKKKPLKFGWWKLPRKKKKAAKKILQKVINTNYHSFELSKIAQFQDQKPNQNETY